MEQQKDALLRIIGTVQAKYNESSIFATELQSTLDSLESAYKDSIYELDSQFKILAQCLENARNRMVEEIDKDLLEKEKPLQERLNSFEDARLDAEELISLSNEALVIMDPSDFSKRALKIKDRVTMSPVFRLSLSPLEIDPACYYVTDFSREQRVINQMNFLPVPCQPEVIGSSCFVEDNVVHCIWSAVDEDDHGAFDSELFSEAPASVYSEMPTILPSSVNYFILQYRQSDENESDNEPWTTVENIRSLEYDIKGLVFHKTSVEIRVQAWNKALGGGWSVPCMVPTDAYNFTLNPDACHPNLKVVTENMVEWDPTATKVPEVRIRSAGPNRSASPVKGIGSSPRRSKTKDRFTGESYTVLGDVAFTEEESYFEVTPDPECKTYSIGITAKTLSRFDQLGRTPTSWCIHVSKWIQNTYVAKHNNKVKNLETSGVVPSRFGVYYNLSAGLLSFYNADTKQAVHTFKQVKYNGAILPGFLIWFGSIKIHTGIQVPSWIVSRPSNSFTPGTESSSHCSNDTNDIPMAVAMVTGFNVLPRNYSRSSFCNRIVFQVWLLTFAAKRFSHRYYRNRLVGLCFYLPFEIFCTMKRRNVDSGKPRRTLKRTNKFAEGVYGSSFVYLKFVLVWCLILLADFVLEFRFEYLWPFWLLIRSVCDSFKYQGLALSVFFVGIAITSDMICLLFIPIQWLFFMASTYVWVQYIWHTDKGICLPTVSLWLLFMYIEATIRLKDLKNSPFHVDLCRPFAAHCIGYPVVTLGFGFKSYVQYRLRLRTQREVQKENEFYRELLSGAMPPELRTQALPSTEKNSIKGSNSVENGMITNGTIPQSAQSHSINNNASSKKEKNQSSQRPSSLQDSNSSNRNAQSSSNDSSPTCRSSPPSKTAYNSCNNATSTSNQNQNLSTSRKIPNQQTNNLSSSNSADKEKPQTISASNVGMSLSEIQQSSGTEIRRRNNSSCNVQHSPTSSSTSSVSSMSSSPSKKSSNGINIVPAGSEIIEQTNKNSSSRSSSTSNGSNSPKSNKYTSSNGHMLTISNDNKQVKPSRETASNEDKGTIKSKKNDALRIQELENRVSKLQFELYSTQQCEGNLRLKNYALLNDEKSTKNELAQLRRDNDQLQTKLHNLVNVKQKDKMVLATMEKKLKAEMEAREIMERILQEERKMRKEDDDMTAKAVALATSNREKVNAEENKRNFKQLEREYENLKNQLKEKEEVCKSLEKEIASLCMQKKMAKETDTLMSALAAMQEKNLMLEKSLSAETRLKLDLFSALGDAKRQLEIAHGMMFKKDTEIRELKSRVADVLSVLPESQIRSSTPHYSSTFLEKQHSQSHVPLSPTQHYSAAFCTVPVQTSPLSPTASGMESLPAMIHMNHMMTHSQGMIQLPLDPNAAIYTPAPSGN